MQDSGIMINVPGMHFAKEKKCNQAKPNENYTVKC